MGGLLLSSGAASTLPRGPQRAGEAAGPGGAPINPHHHLSPSHLAPPPPPSTLTPPQSSTLGGESSPSHHLNLSCASPREVWVSEPGSQMPSLSVLLMAQATDCHQETRAGGSGRGSCGSTQDTAIRENPVIGRPGLPTLSSQPGLPQALLTRAAMLSSPSISSAENLLSLHAKRALAGRGCFHQEPGQINPAKLPPQWNRWDVRTLPSAQASCSSPLSWEGAPGPQSPLLGNEEYSRKTTAMALQIGWPLETTG